MPLEIRRNQIALTYWANLKGHKEIHPTQKVLQPCQEKERRHIKSFGWIIRDAVDEIGIGEMVVSPILPLSNVPPWLLGEMEVDLHLLEWKKENRSNSCH